MTPEFLIEAILEGYSIEEAWKLEEKMIEDPASRRQLDGLGQEESSLRDGLDAIQAREGTTGGGNLYHTDPEFKRLYDRLQAIQKEKADVRKSLFRNRQVVDTYVRFGNLPKTRSVNHLVAKNSPRRFEVGISAYRARYDQELEAWDLDLDDIRSSNYGTVETCAYEFMKGRINAMLIKATEMRGEEGSDGEPMLDPRTIKIVKELDRFAYEGELVLKG